MVDQVRRFNRTVTQRIGALSDEFLAGAVRLARLACCGRSDPAAATSALRARLDLDSGYLSRLLRSLEGTA